MCFNSHPSLGIRFHYYLHFPDVETKAQLLKNLPQVTLSKQLASPLSLTAPTAFLANRTPVVRVANMPTLHPIPNRPILVLAFSFLIYSSQPPLLGMWPSSDQGGLRSLLGGFWEKVFLHDHRKAYFLLALLFLPTWMVVWRCHPGAVAATLQRWSNWPQEECCHAKDGKMESGECPGLWGLL